MVTKQITVVTRNPHEQQRLFLESKAKRKIIRAGRRGGKTVGMAIAGIESFLDGHRVLYAAPTSEQTDRFWFEVMRALEPLIKTGAYKVNQTERFIERIGTENRIKAKTAWNANSLRGDYADLLILDEWQLMAEDTWEDVGAPMLIDNNGDAVFIYTPPSLRATGISRAHDPRHASKMFKRAAEDETGRWATFHFTSHDNPYLSTEALIEITQDMSVDSYRKEIMAEDEEIESSWLVYGVFNEEVCKVKRFDIPRNWDILTGHDFGSANPAALFLSRVKLPLPSGAPPYMRQNDIVIWHEYAPGGGLSVGQHTERFRELTDGLNVVKRVGGNQTTEDEIRQAYTMQGWHIQAPVITKVNAQLDRVINLMENNRIFIFEDLFGLLGQIANCLWELDDENRPLNKVKDEAKYHYLACLRYIGSCFDPVSSIQQGTQFPVGKSQRTGGSRTNKTFTVMSRR